MNIIQVNYSDGAGGAARAAYRLHKGLLAMGRSSQMIVRDKLTDDANVITVSPKPVSKSVRRRFDDVQKFINSFRTPVSNTLFSFCYPGMDISNLSAVTSADIINLHWVASQFQSPTTLKKLFDLGIPVVWTLHDQWPFTGGCHYSAGCENYKYSCGNCPQLSANSLNLPSRVLQDKLDLYRNANLTIVTPSKWMKECVKESRLFNNNRVEWIPNALETDIFVPKNKRDAKERLGIGSDMKTLLFGAENGKEKRKGYLEMLQALEYCRKDPRLEGLLSRGGITILLFGHPGEELIQTGFPVHSLGYVSSDDQLADIYSSADLFVLPSLEDNLPNTMLESMSCGTPVVAFDVGGMKDVIQNDITGKLVQAGNSRDMGQAIVDLILHSDLTKLGSNCRPLIQERFRLDIQASSYLDLYKGVLGKPKREFFINGMNHRQQEIPVEITVAVDTTIGKHVKCINRSISNKYRRYKIKRKIMALGDRIRRLLFES